MSRLEKFGIFAILVVIVIIGIAGVMMPGPDTARQSGEQPNAVSLETKINSNDPQVSLMMLMQPLGSDKGRVRVAVDDCVSITITAQSDCTVGNMTFSLTGQMLRQNFVVDLIDADTNASWGSSTQQVCKASEGNDEVVVFHPKWALQKGESKKVKIRINSSNFGNSAGPDELKCELVRTIWKTPSRGPESSDAYASITLQYE